MALFISGCNDNKELLSRIKALEDNLESLKSTVEINEFVSQFSNNNVAFLKPGDGGYSVVNFDLGKLTIAIDNATQYAGGVRVTFKIGNTLSSTITELSADFEYGQLNENKTPTENIIRKKVKFQDELKGGSWNKTTVVLEGIELKDLGYIRIKNLSHSGIKLTGRY
jgi:hypothetical protein